jgi:subtilase family serine protease
MSAPHVRRRTVAKIAAGAAGLAALAALSSAGAVASASAGRVDRLPVAVPDIAGNIGVVGHYTATPPTTKDCEESLGLACDSPIQIEDAYHMPELYQKGLTGAGTTIAVVDSFGSPTIQSDLRIFDKQYGLPNPNLSIIQPSGAVPRYNPNNSVRVGWAEETTLDVEYSHAMAPGANILLVETPVAETEGDTGLPELMDAEQYVVQHKLADVISQSFGATEETFADPKADIARLEYAFTAAAKAHIPVLASAGDDGATGAQLHGSSDYPYRTTGWPATDPLVTAVGGTMLDLGPDGHRLSPDVVWNDGYGAGAGGLSSVFARPSYQDGVKSVVGAKRGVPDISLSASVNGGVIVYFGFGGLPKGYYFIGGTSEASPLLSGIVAIATQKEGHPIGALNPQLYALAATQGYSEADGLVDVTSGNNSFAGVTGYTAGPGYDLASGLGTVAGPGIVDALAKG